MELKKRENKVEVTPPLLFATHRIGTDNFHIFPAQCVVCVCVCVRVCACVTSLAAVHRMGLGLHSLHINRSSSFVVP